MENGETGRIFISYRRQETAWPARQLHQLLVAELGADRVFKDVDDIEPGDDFVERIQWAVGSCRVLLALIGPQWLTVVDAKGARRIDDPADFVRLEIETALNRDHVRVIPILVDNAKMPTPEELPAGLAALARRHAVEIDPVNFDTHRLMRVLNYTLNDVPGGPVPPSTFDQGVEVQPPRTRPPVPRIESGPGAADGTSDTWVRPSAPAGAGSGGAAVRRRAPLFVAVATAIALLGLAGGVAVWYFSRDPGQRTSTAGQVTSEPSSSTPSVITSASSSASKASTPVDPTGSDILAHRGGDEKYPLETFESLTSAADDGFAVETDVRWTSDKRAVIVHDQAATQGIRCDRPYRVSTTTWKELNEHCRSFTKDQKSYPLTTYANLMEGLASYRSWVYVEVKVDQNASQDREFVEAITSNGLSDRTVVTSTDLGRLARVQKLAPDVPRLLFVSEEVPLSRLVHQGLWGIAVNMDVASKDYIRKLKEAGLVVIVWTVNDEQAWKKARSVGADKVLTDKPRAYAAWLAKQ